MEKMKHLLGSRSASAGGMVPPTSSPELRSASSIFHINNSNNNSCSPSPSSTEELDSLGQEMRECYQGLEEFGRALRNLDGAGTHLTETLAGALQGTCYQGIGEQLARGFRQVYGSQGSLRLLEQLKEMEGLVLTNQLPRDGSQDDPRTMHAQTSCHMLLLFAKLQKQYFQLCHQKMADLIHPLLTGKIPDRSGQVAKLILKLGLAEEMCPDKAIASLPSTPWGSPKLRKASHSSPKSQSRSFKLFNFFERKPSPEEGNSAFYVSVPPESDGPAEAHLIPEILVDLGSQPMTAGSQGSVQPTHEGSLLGSVPLVTRTDEMNNDCALDITLEDTASNHLATEEDIDSIINLLSGLTCPSPTSSPIPAPPTPNSMLSIPEDPLRDTSPSTPNSMHSGPELPPSRSPMQLTVPSVYRMRSPVSDSHVDELQIPRLQAQVHRRSEGCLDLSNMGRSTWPHQQHRASLPAVQLHTPYRLNFDPIPDPLTLPPHYLAHDFGLPSRPPPGYLGSSSSGGGSGSGNGSMCSAAGGGGGFMASGMQWSSFGGAGGGGSGGGNGMEMRNSGTWPLYQPLSMPLGDSLNSSWSGAQDGSDGSDDSSNGDHFFAVGKDLVNAIDSRHDSSDDEGDKGKNKIHKDFFDYERQTGCTNTWPMMQHLPSSGLHFPAMADYPDLLDPPPPPQPPHRPLQMQWSDPVASRNVWSAADPAGVSGQKSTMGVQAAHSNASHNMHTFGPLT